MAWTRTSSRPHSAADPLEERVERGRVLHVGRQHDRRADALGERDHPAAEALALVGEGELGALRGEGPGDAPGDRMVVGDAEDQRALACEQPGLPHRLTHDSG